MANATTLTGVRTGGGKETTEETGTEMAIHPIRTVTEVLLSVSVARAKLFRISSLVCPAVAVDGHSYDRTRKVALLQF